MQQSNKWEKSRMIIDHWAFEKLYAYSFGNNPNLAANFSRKTVQIQADIVQEEGDNDTRLFLPRNIISEKFLIISCQSFSEQFS